MLQRTTVMRGDEPNRPDCGRWPDWPIGSLGDGAPVNTQSSNHSDPLTEASTAPFGGPWSGAESTCSPRTSRVVPTMLELRVSPESTTLPLGPSTTSATALFVSCGCAPNVLV
jgi:hypothetical protein